MADQPVSASAMEPFQLVNSLAKSTSPYIRGHKDDPVAWQEWTPSTLSLAKKHNRLIFLSIGFHACHWCHVMQHESFASPEVATILNTSFIPIKVDREARPDIDEIYMNYVNATTGSGGWPLNVFLTSNLDPVFGGTYWPGPGSTLISRVSNSLGEDASLNFLEVLEKIRSIWTTQEERCSQSARTATQQLRDFAADGTHSQSQAQATADSSDSTPDPLELDLLDDALSHFQSRYDAVNGGFSSTPKFPAQPKLAFLLRIGASITTTSTRFGFPSPVPPILGKQGCVTAASMALHTLRSISRSAVRDHLGYGFHRYSVTSDWNLPHFEKMLPDNAQLLSVYCDAWALSQDPEILGAIYNLVEYLTALTSPILSPDGAFFSSEDADSHPSKSVSSPTSEKREGALYVWTLKEITSILPNPTSCAILARHFGISANGNVPLEHDTHDEFLTQNTLRIACTPSVLAKEFGLPESEIVATILAGSAALRRHRDAERDRPAVDNKVVAGWNALAISALCRAANTLEPIDRARSERCRVGALRAAEFLRTKMCDANSGRVARIYDAGTAAGDAGAGFVDDYAYLTAAALALYDMTFEPAWLHWAVQLQAYLDEHFRDRDRGGYFQTEDETTTATEPRSSSSSNIVRLKPGIDTALPSPNGVIAMNLLYLSGYGCSAPPQQQLGTDSAVQVQRARETIEAFAVEVVQHPFLFVTLLGAVVLDQVGVKAIVVQGEMAVEEMRRLDGWGRTVVRMGTGSDVGKKVLVCEHGVCRELGEGELDERVDGDLV